MKLYYAPKACSLASHIALHETGLLFEIDKLNVPTKTTSSGEDFMQLNPKGYMPVIKLGDGSILTEGVVILQYIADQKPDSRLAQKAGTMERYRLQEWLNLIGTEVHKSFSPLFNPSASDVSGGLYGNCPWVGIDWRCGWHCNVCATILGDPAGAMGSDAKEGSRPP